MLKFCVESIRYHRQGITLEIREVGEQVDPNTKDPIARFRCSAPASGPNFSLSFQPTDPLYSKAAEARIGTVLELSLQLLSAA